MYSRIIYEKVPAFYEIIFDENPVSISFSLCPEANDYFLKMLEQTNRIIDHLESEEKFSKFIFPKEGKWGFGGVFSLNNSKSIEKNWTTWECLLPKKATQKKLNEISGSINVIISLMHIFDCNEKEKREIKDEIQFMTIDTLMVTPERCLHGGGFSFSFARPVLDFYSKIWGEDKRFYNEIVAAMQKTWMQLMGQEQMKSYEKHSFRVGVSQGDSRLLSLSCPGNCA